MEEGVGPGAGIGAGVGHRELRGRLRGSQRRHRGAEKPRSREAEKPRSPGTFDCALPPETLTEITDLTFIGVEPDGGGFGGTRGSLAWQGCTYETGGDAQVMIAIIVDAQGEPDVASYDRFAEGAGRSSEPVLVDGNGDSAVRYRDRLYFRSGDTAYAVSGEDDQDDPLAPEVLEEIAVAVVDAG